MKTAGRIQVPMALPIAVVAVLAFSLLLPRGEAVESVSVHDQFFSPSASAGGDSVLPIVSPDGRFVLFSSAAGNLVLTGQEKPLVGGLPSRLNVYLRDRAIGTTKLVSADPAGDAGGDDDSLPLGISANGQFVLFESFAANLVTDDTNAASDVFVRDMLNGLTELISVAVDGHGGNGASRTAVMTPYARYIAFVSEATNLVAGDTNAVADVFVRDRLVGTTVLASLNGASPVDGLLTSGSDSPVITPDGRYVAFYNEAMSGSPYPQPMGEIYVRDLVTETTARASINASTLLQSSPSLNRTISCSQRISDDGRYIAFTAFTNTASSLYRSGYILRHDLQTGITEVVSTDASVPLSRYPDVHNLDMTGDGRFITFIAVTNASGLTGGEATCILRWDAPTAQTTLVSGDLSNGVPAGSFCDFPSLSSAGQQVAFVSSATNLTTNVLSGDLHVYVRDVASGITSLVNVDTNDVGLQVDFGTSPRLNAYGNCIAFACPGAGLVPDDRNRSHDVFVRDLTLNTTELVSVRHSALPSMTANGVSGLDRFSVSTNGRYVVFTSDADDLVSNDSNGLRDVFVHDRVTGSNSLVSVATNGMAGSGLSSEPTISGDGRYVAFSSAASDLATVDSNNARDVFVRDLVSGTTTLASASYSTNLISFGRDSFSPQISADGRFVMFRSEAAYLTPVYLGGGVENLFVRDLLMGTNYALTTATSSTGVTDASMTAEGRFVAFAGRIGSGNTFLYVWDTQLAARIYTNTTAGLTSVSISPNGEHIAFVCDGPMALYVADWTANTNSLVSMGTFESPTSTGLRFSQDGRFLAYATSAANVPGDTNATQDVYLYDTQTGTNALVSRSWFSETAANAASDSPSISADGRFVAYRSAAEDIVPGDGNGVPDLVLFDRVNQATVLVSVNRDGDASADNRSIDAVFSADSSVLVFRSWAADIVGMDFNQRGDLLLLPLTAPAITDSDLDGMDDGWESDHFGNLARTGEGDYDLDGATDLFEFQTGTNPTDAHSLFRTEIQMPEPPGRGPTLTWPARSWGAYRVQYRDELGDPSWQALPGNVTLFGNTGSATDLSPAERRRFYRVMLTE